MQCCACEAGRILPLLTFAQVPISGIYLESADKTLQRYDIKLSYCEACGLTTRDRISTPMHDYSHIDRGTSQQMPDYANDILKSLRDAGLRDTASILEVGSNDGSFLTFLTKNGFKTLTGIEPSTQLAKIAEAKGFKIDNAYCSTENAAGLRARHGTFDAIICRHTLEHVPDPEDLMRAIGMLLKPGALCLIEVPDFEWVLETLAVHEIWDEHISYFSKPNLQLLHTRLGFEPISSQQIRFRDTRNLVTLSRWPGTGTGTATGKMRPADIKAAQLTAKHCSALPAVWSDYVKRLAAAAKSWPRPVMAVGASHIQANYIHFAQLASVVTALIDDDPHKRGKFVELAKPVPVVSTADALKSTKAGTVLRTAFPYPSWMDKIAAELTPRGVRLVEPYTSDLITHMPAPATAKA
jgi:2-polyprenyl-3-methyl-5-hydroxy-6-metoxy-1,4-benzoquinol methylase